MVIARKYSLDCSGSSEATTPPELAEADDAADGDPKEEVKDVSTDEEPAPSAGGDAATDEAPQEPPAEGAEAEPEKAEEPAGPAGPAEPPADDSEPKPDDDGNNGTEHYAAHVCADANDWQTKIFQNVTLRPDSTR